MKKHLRLVLLGALTLMALTLAAWGQPAPGTGGPLPGAAAAPAAGAPGAPVLGAPQMPAAPVAEPASLDDAWGMVCIGDVAGFIDGVGQVASQFQPMMNGMMMKGMVGGQLGDPTFDGFPAGSGAVVVFFAPMQYTVFLGVAPAKTDAYVAALQAAGQQPGSPVGSVLRFVDKAEGVVIGGRSQAELALAKKIAADVKKRYLAGAGKPTLVATVFPQKGLPLVEPKILPLMQMAAAAKQMQQAQKGANVGVAPEPTPAPGTMTPERMAEAEVRVLLSLAHQSNSVDLTFAPAGGGVRFDLAASAKPDSNFGKFLATAAPKGTDVQKLVPAKGAIRGSLTHDSAALATLMKSEIDNLATQMTLTPDEKDALQKYQDMQTGMQASAAAFDFFVPGGPLISGSAIYEVADPVKAMAKFKDAPQNMQGMMKMYENMGMKMTMDFKENARQVKGVSVSHATITVQTDPAKIMGPEGDLLKKVWGEGISGDVATVDKLLLLAVGGQSIDDLIAAAQAKSNAASRPLTAATVLGANGQGYGDVDPGLVAKVLVAAFAPADAQASPNELKPADIADGLQGAAPVTVAGFWGQGPQSHVSLDIPADLVAKAAALFAKEQALRSAGRMGGGNGNGPGVPAPMGAPGAVPPPRPQF